MFDVIDAIDRWLAAGQQVAIATVVRTAGSTPRPLGSRLAVSSEGSMAGSVSGGCIEGAVFEEAQTVLRTGVPTRVEYGVTDEQAWAVGLSCGGTIEVFIEPVVQLDGERDDAGEADYETLRRLVIDEQSAWSVTRLGEFGASEGPPIGQRIVHFDEGSTVGTFGSAEHDAAAVRHCIEAEETGVVRDEDLGGDLFVERFAPQPTLYIIGAVHVAIHLVHLAGRAGFRCVVIDARAAFATEERFPHADELLLGWPSELLADRRLHDQSYCVFLTHDPKLDDPALRVVLDSPARYVGALGSRRTHAKRIDSLRELGVADDAVARIRAPIGLDLGGRRPQEIAVSIVAQLVAARYDRLDETGALIPR